MTGVLITMRAEVAGFVDLPLVGGGTDLMNCVVYQVAYLGRSRNRVEDCGLAVPVGPDDVDEHVPDSLTAWNEESRLFVWTKTAGEILDAVSSYCR
ncbi:hypothetical protein [Actinomadura algeriensis]|uniref:Uncharacterized protein n=1 Tax=Actinomadura algeriensis TaxID=1679523 RepID=A0ABR9K278_9ACTN|nr:hypothetical protein [Actinomadura algeriensis]MBE1536933.1 hypothetical protein [Actinomadura algeriensis]